VIIRGWHGYYKTLKPVTPPNILSLIVLVKVGRHFGEMSIARDLLKKSVDFKHSHPEVSFQLGELFSGMGMQHQAMREYAKALELDPTMEKAKDKIRCLQEDEADTYKAIEKIQLVLHHNPDYREGYEKLAAHYTELGLYGFAERAYQKALDIDIEPHATGDLPKIPSSLDKKDFDYQAIDQDVFLSVFTGRKDSHAKQWVDERGKWGFSRVERPLKKTDVYSHLKGEITLAVFPVTEQDTVNFIVFDVDTVKRKILESDTRSIEDFIKAAHHDILRIKTVCKQMDIKLYIEDSGYKGRHGWLFFSAKIAASEALAIGQRIMKKAGRPSEGMMWELFPMGKSERHKSLIKLPLGINRKNNRRCLFLSDDGNPVQDQGLVLKSLKKNDIELLRKHMPDLNKSGEASGQQEPSISAGLKKMIENCHFLKHLIAKSKDTHYLNHYERICLLYTLTFAGKEGCDFLHKVISYCINYNPQYTQLQIDKRKESPISCARIMEYFPEVTESLPCDCSFKLPPKGYPSPVLYLLESEIEQAYQFNPSDAEVKTQKQPTETVVGAKEEEVPVLDFEGIFSSDAHEEEAVTIEKAQPHEIPDDELPSESDSPQRDLASSSHILEPDDNLPFEPDSIQEKSDINQTPYEEASVFKNAVTFETPASLEVMSGTTRNAASAHDAWELILELMRLKVGQEKIRKEFISVQSRLNQIFDSQGVETLTTPMGTIRREGKSEKGQSQWIITA
jgi:hypothetical protein